MYPGRASVERRAREVHASAVSAGDFACDPRIFRRSPAFWSACSWASFRRERRFQHVRRRVVEVGAPSKLRGGDDVFVGASQCAYPSTSLLRSGALARMPTTSYEQSGHPLWCVTAMRLCATWRPFAQGRGAHRRPLGRRRSLCLQLAKHLGQTSPRSAARHFDSFAPGRRPCHRFAPQDFNRIDRKWTYLRHGRRNHVPAQQVGPHTQRPLVTLSISVALLSTSWRPRWSQVPSQVRHQIVPKQKTWKRSASSRSRSRPTHVRELFRSSESWNRTGLAARSLHAWLSYANCRPFVLAWSEACFELAGSSSCGPEPLVDNALPRRARRAFLMAE